MKFTDKLRAWFGIAPAKRDAYTGVYGGSGGSGFAGGSVNRLTASLATWSGAVNSDLDGSLVVLRARARMLAQSNEHGKRFLTQVATNVVGRAGPKLQVRAYRDQRDPNKPTTLDKAANDAIEIHYARWCKTADIAGRMSFAHLLRVVAKAVARDGEALVRTVRDRKLPYGIALQVLEADRLDENLNLKLPSGAIRQGVEIDTTGRPVALWLRATHPGERYAQGTNTAERVPIEQVYHVFLQERAEQVRGYTWFHAILLRASQLHGFNEAAVLAARIGASKIAALERTEESVDATASMADGQAGAALQMNVEAGELFELPPGYTLNSWNPEYPHANYDSFVKSAMRGIASGLDVATHNLSGDMTDVNYSSARIAELGERDVWMMLQDWLIGALVEPVYNEWLASALLRGDITFEISGKALPADRYAKFANASRFQGRRWRWVDPAKEIDAFTKGVELGVVSRTRIAAEQGDDIDDVIDELSQERDMLEEAGLLPEEPVEPTGEPAEPSAPVVDGGAKELAAAIVALASREQRTEIHNHVAASPVTVQPADVHNAITVQPAEVKNSITLPESSITVEAHIETPHPARKVTEIERDAAHEAVRTVETYEMRG